MIREIVLQVWSSVFQSLVAKEDEDKDNRESTLAAVQELEHVQRIEVLTPFSPPQCCQTAIKEAPFMTQISLGGGGRDVCKNRVPCTAQFAD